MKNNFKSLIKPPFVLFIICLAVTVFLAGTYYFAKPKIDERSRQQITETRKMVLSEAAEFDEISENAVCGKNSSGNTVGYVITVTQKGYGGNMQVMVGINEDGKVSGVSILSHSETPGLGAKTAEEGFLSQFTGLSDEAEVGDEIDGITGATVSSRAVTEAVNNAIDEYKEISKEDEK